MKQLAHALQDLGRLQTVDVERPELLDQRVEALCRLLAGRLLAVGLVGEPEAEREGKGDGEGRGVGPGSRQGHHRDAGEDQGGEQDDAEGLEHVATGRSPPEQPPDRLECEVLDDVADEQADAQGQPERRPRLVHLSDGPERCGDEADLKGCRPGVVEDLHRAEPAQGHAVDERSADAHQQVHPGRHQDGAQGQREVRERDAEGVLAELEVQRALRGREVEREQQDGGECERHLEGDLAGQGQRDADGEQGQRDGVGAGASRCARVPFP